MNWRLPNTPNDLLVHHGQIRYSNCMACCQKFNLDSTTRDREKNKLWGLRKISGTFPVPQCASDLLVGGRVILGAPASPGQHRLKVGVTIGPMWHNHFPDAIFPPVALPFSKVLTTDASSTGGLPCAILVINLCIWHKFLANR